VLGKLQTAVFQGFSTWRDVKTIGNYAYVVAEVGNHGIQVFDLTRLRGLSEDASRDFTEDARYVGFGSAHNIVADEASDMIYGVGASAPQCGGGGLHMVDVSDPLQPTFAGCFDNDGYTHDAQCLVYDGPDTEHAGKPICVASNEDTITVVDVSDPALPIQLSRGFYPSPSYTHQGWFTEDRRHFIVNDELDRGLTRTIVFDMEDLDSPSFAFIHTADLFVTDHNHYVRGDYLFQSNYEAGLRILDLSNLDGGSMTEVGFFDTYPAGNSESFEGQWSNYPYFESGIVVASDQANGLFVLRPDPQFVSVAGEAAPEAPAEAFDLSAPVPNPASGVSTLTLRVAEPQHVTALVYDLTGRRVAAALDRTLRAGETAEIAVDGSALPAGVYVVRVAGETFEASQRLAITR
jgi:choice-of-anchor B domain-containing protein